MEDYFLPSEGQITIEEKKWIFKCRTDDIDIKGNNRWKYDDISCISCKNRNKEEIQTLHDLESLEMQLAQCSEIPNSEIIGPIIEKVIANKEKQLEK